MMYRKLSIFSLLIVPMFFVTVGTTTAQQRRDYLTEAEVELVRDAQDIDERIVVLTRAADRRFNVLKIDVGSLAVTQKESGKWGPAPTGSRLELLEDIKRLLQKAIDDIDNVAAHPVDYSLDKDRTEKQKKKETQRFPSAVRALAAAAKRYSPALRSLVGSSTDEKEKGIILDSIESCDQIIEAVAKLPAETSAN